MSHHLMRLEPLKLTKREVKTPWPSIEEPSSLELKQLPSHLKYVDMGKDSTLLVIIVAKIMLEDIDGKNLSDIKDQL
ncbi:hypothetical protein V6N13_141956 [Hibiscus sabdariffa]|uniref:Uncharacterized protein n=1 Tax=Hibiscus sabdariffa TaxID=183260 RepID=A0ABR2FCN9_9ROSI